VQLDPAASEGEGPQALVSGLGGDALDCRERLVDLGRPIAGEHALVGEVQGALDQRVGVLASFEHGERLVPATREAKLPGVQRRSSATTHSRLSPTTCARNCACSPIRCDESTIAGGAGLVPAGAQARDA
jgi:hypothetical protein